MIAYCRLKGYNFSLSPPLISLQFGCLESKHYSKLVFAFQPYLFSLLVCVKTPFLKWSLKKHSLEPRFFQGREEGLCRALRSLQGCYSHSYNHLPTALALRLHSQGPPTPSSVLWPSGGFPKALHSRVQNMVPLYQFTHAKI